MKRLSKSASDLSGCKKKTHSTSPDEEEKPMPYSTPPHRLVLEKNPEVKTDLTQKFGTIC